MREPAQPRTPRFMVGICEHEAGTFGPSSLPTRARGVPLLAEDAVKERLLDAFAASEIATSQGDTA